VHYNYSKRETVIITGASVGHGLGRRGARVGLLARGRDGLEAAKREIEPKPNPVQKRVPLDDE
jgi:short-subunit dehydrogenase